MFLIIFCIPSQLLSEESIHHKKDLLKLLLKLRDEFYGEVLDLDMFRLLKDFIQILCLLFSQNITVMKYTQNKYL